jgi:hypothetical protein
MLVCCPFFQRAKAPLAITEGRLATSDHDQIISRRGDYFWREPHWGSLYFTYGDSVVTDEASDRVYRWEELEPG